MIIFCRLLVSSFSEEQLNRYEMYRRAAFPKAAIKRVIFSISMFFGSQSSEFPQITALLNKEKIRNTIKNGFYLDLVICDDHGLIPMFVAAVWAQM